ncbi:lipopolysaccharide biosynthesis protein [Alkalimarinus coralli]|uniref:lipopolysaccharide biosynthesis protein n=1 Tax=Alkalimarinus coralli TaxID=2935863 RepID=UPI00202AD279|nr:lipopolysaccharide biosynthesis protein [Alkalimarinus coralli]
MSIKKKAIKGAGWFALQRAIEQVIHFVVFLILARLLSPEAFGTVALAIAVMHFIEIFLDQGFTSAIIQRDKLDEKHLNSAFWSNLCMGLLLTGIAMASSDAIADIFKQPILSPIIWCLTLSLILGSLSTVQQAILRRDLDFKSLAIRNLIASAAGGVVGIVMAVSGFGVWSLVGKQIAEYVVKIVVLWRVCDWRPKREFSFQHFKELFNFGIHVTGIHFLGFIYNHSATLLIGFFLGAKSLGYYVIAARIIKILKRLLSTTIGNVGLPAFSRLQNEPDRVISAFYSFTRFTALFVIPAFVGIIYLAPDFLTTVFGNRWQNSIVVLQLLAIFAIIDSLRSPMATLIMGLGKANWRLQLQFAESLGVIIGIYIAHFWGINAIAMAFVVVSTCVFPFWYIKVEQLVDVSIKQFVIECLPPIVCTLVMLIPVYLIQQWDTPMPEKIRLLLAILGAIVAYFAALRIVSPNTFEQLEKIVKSFTKKKPTKAKIA